MHDRAARLTVGEQLFGVLGQALAAVAEEAVVVMGLAAQLQTHAPNDALGVQTEHAGIDVHKSRSVRSSYEIASRFIHACQWQAMPVLTSKR